VGGRAWLVDAEGGRFVLRRFPADLASGQAEFAAAVQQCVAVTGGPAMAVVADAAGRLVARVEDQAFVMVRFAEGQCRPEGFPPAELCREFGRALGRIHRCLRSRPDLAAGSPRVTSDPADPAAAIRGALARHGPDCPHAHTRQVLAAKLAQAQALSPSALTLPARLPASVIHGDFHPGNVVVDGGRATAVLDFDLARVCPPGYEVVRGLLYCVKPTGGHQRFSPRATAFLSGYLGVSSLSQDEVSTMVELYRVVQILDVHGLDVCGGAGGDLLAFGMARFALLRWLDRYGAVLSALAESVRSSLSSPPGDAEPRM
jgi:Ser/Thr protein kinase RdoA (MazF antagonist)